MFLFVYLVVGVLMALSGDKTGKELVEGKLITQETFDTLRIPMFLLWVALWPILYTFGFISALMDNSKDV